MATPKKSPAAIAAAASAPVVEPSVETAPFVEAAPAFNAAPVVEATPVAPVAETLAIAEPAPPLRTEAAVPAPFAAVSKILEAPIASLTEAQGKVRSLVETSLSETQSKFTQMKSAAGEAAQAIETSYATVKDGAVQFNVKALEALTDTANANFAFFKSVFAVKSPSEFVTLQTEFARQQIERLTAQTKTFGELAQKVAVDTVEPIKAQVTKALGHH